MGSKRESSNLLDDNINFVTILHVEVFGSLSLMQSLAIEEKSDIVEVELIIRVFLRFGAGSRHPSAF